MNFILQNYPNGYAEHFIVGVILLIFLSYSNRNFIIVLLIALIKEIIDSMGMGNVDFWDIFFTMISWIIVKIYVSLKGKNIK
jgi:hypothetical protein